MSRVMAWPTYPSWWAGQTLFMEAGHQPQARVLEPAPLACLCRALAMLGHAIGLAVRRLASACFMQEMLCLLGLPVVQAVLSDSRGKG